MSVIAQIETIEVAVSGIVVKMGVEGYSFTRGLSSSRALLLTAQIIRPDMEGQLYVLLTPSLLGEEVHAPMKPTFQDTSWEIFPRSVLVPKTYADMYDLAPDELMPAFYNNRYRVEHRNETL